MNFDRDVAFPNKITIYELLGLIKDGKAPKKIIYADITYKYCERMEGKFNYKNIETGEYLSDDWFIENILCNIVEIIEEVEDKEYEDITLLKEDYIQEFENMSGIKQQYIIKTLMEIALKKM